MDRFFVRRRRSAAAAVGGRARDRPAQPEARAPNANCQRDFGRDAAAAENEDPGRDMLLALARVGIANAPETPGPRSSGREDGSVPRLLPSPPVQLQAMPRTPERRKRDESKFAENPYLNAKGTVSSSCSSANGDGAELAQGEASTQTKGRSRGRSLTEKRHLQFGQKTPVLDLTLALSDDDDDEEEEEEEDGPFGRMDTDLKSVSTQATLWLDELDELDQSEHGGSLDDDSKSRAESGKDEDYFRNLFARDKNQLRRQHSCSLSEAHEQKSPSLRRRSTRGRPGRSESVYYELSSSGTLHVPGFLVRTSGVSPTPNDHAHVTSDTDMPLSRRPAAGLQSPMSQRSEASVESKTQGDDAHPRERRGRPRRVSLDQRHGLRALAASNNLAETRKHGPGSSTPSAPLGKAFQSKSLEFLGRVGKGASGIVYKALHRDSMRLVAVKAVPVFDDSKRAQTVSEIKALYKDHLVPLDTLHTEQVFPRTCPYIVGMHNAYVDRSESTINLVLEWMGGGSLEDRLASHGALSEGEIACVLHCVFRGLRHLHGQRQLHRDIKPANMLLSQSSGLVKLSDFGISHSFGSFSAANTFVGSLSYMAPERITGDQDGYSYPADVWSVGLSALVCAMGSYPFQTEFNDQGYWGLVQAIGERASPRLPRDRFSGELCDLISGCLRKDPQHRITAVQALEHPFLAQVYPYAQVVGSSFAVEDARGASEVLWQDFRKLMGLAPGPVDADVAHSLASQVGLKLTSKTARKLFDDELAAHTRSL